MYCSTTSTAYRIVLSIIYIINKSKYNLKTHCNKKCNGILRTTQCSCTNQFVPIRSAHGQISYYAQIGIMICLWVILLLSTHGINVMHMDRIYNSAHTGLALCSCAVSFVVPMCILLSF